jgi:hypothetical protein
LTLLILDPMTDAGPWQAKAPGGTQSQLLSAAVDNGLVISAQAGAVGHYLERTLPAPVDLSAHSDLQTWLSADREATGNAASPFYLELRIGSAGAAIGSAPNTWQRYLPVQQAGVRSLVTLALGDLQPSVRGAVTTLRLTCTDGSAPFAARLEQIAALDEQILADIDAALLARLDRRVTAQGAQVQAILAETGATLPNPPYLRITNFDVRTADERSSQVPVRTDYTDSGFTLRPPRTPFDAMYEIECVANDRTTEAATLQYLLADFAPRTTLLVNDWPLTCELVGIPAALGATRPERVVAWLRVCASVRKTASPQPAIPPIRGADITLGQAPQTAALA